jgi:hypothetical protein
MLGSKEAHCSELTVEALGSSGRRRRASLVRKITRHEEIEHQVSIVLMLAGGFCQLPTAAQPKPLAQSATESNRGRCGATDQEGIARSRSDRRPPVLTVYEPVGTYDPHSERFIGRRIVAAAETVAFRSKRCACSRGQRGPRLSWATK